jgi:hypothetical protein
MNEITRKDQEGKRKEITTYLDKYRKKNGLKNKKKCAYAFQGAGRGGIYLSKN